MGAEKGFKGHGMKANEVKGLVHAIKEAKTLMIVSIGGLPSKQFQEIKKTIRAEADIKVAKKNILLRVVDGFDKESILKLKEYIKENCAFAISNLDGFELAGILARNKTPIFAKAGQEALEDIEIKAGPTDLVPGPAISELGALGIQIAVEDGKISIKQPKVIVKKGESIKPEAASMLQKLNIQPFSISLKPLAVYDIASEKIYTDIKIDSEEAIGELVGAVGKALGFAQKIVYYCKNTIGYLLGKANADMIVLGKFVGVEEKVAEPVEEKVAEENPVEDKSEEGKEND